MEKTRDCQLFMTPNDEHLFCKTLREFNPNIYFLDTTPSLENAIFTFSPRYLSERLLTTR